MNDERIDTLIDALGQKKKWAVVDRATKELIEIGLPAVTKVTEALLDPTSGTNDAAGIILGEISPPGIAQILIEACKHESWNVRRASAFSLGIVGDKAALPVLLELLESDEHAYVRISAASALGMIPDVAAIPILTKALRNPKNVAVCPFISVALSKIGEPALPSLLDALCDDTVVDHEAVENALVSLSAPAIPALLSLFTRDDLNWYVLPSAARILGQIGHPSAIPALKMALYKDNDELCSAAAWALSVINDSRVIDILVEALMIDDPMIQGIVAGAISPIVDDRIINTLSGLLADNRRVWENSHMKPVKVKEMAAQALEAIDAEMARRNLENWQEDELL
jgi:HEAT repeat protein